jgi:hypothetical protein
MRALVSLPGYLLFVFAMLKVFIFPAHRMDPPWTSSARWHDGGSSRHPCRRWSCVAALGSARTTSQRTESGIRFHIVSSAASMVKRYGARCRNPDDQDRLCNAGKEIRAAMKSHHNRLGVGQ